MWLLKKQQQTTKVHDEKSWNFYCFMFFFSGTQTCTFFVQELQAHTQCSILLLWLQMEYELDISGISQIHQPLYLSFCPFCFILTASSSECLIYFGYVMCVNSLEKAIMLGIISRIKRRGKKRTRWLDNIRSVTRLNIQQLKEAVLARQHGDHLPIKSPRVRHN